MDKQPNVEDLYFFAKEFVINGGYEQEILWQKKILGSQISETNFLQEAAWVVLCSGFKERIVRQIFSNFSLCYCDWESAKVISDNANLCKSSALKVFPNERKVNAISKIVEKIHKVGFSSFIEKIRNDPITELKTLPFIGEVTSYHLAKNIGFDVSKPDRHLVRISKELGYSDVHSLCNYVSELSGDAPSVVDIVFWRFAEITSGRCWSFATT